MDNKVRGAGQNSGQYTSPPVHEQQTGKSFKQWNVKVSRGRRFLNWCADAARRWIPGVSLVERVTRSSSTVIKTVSNAPRQGKYWQQVPLTTSSEEKRNIAIDSALSQLPYWMNWEDVAEAERLHGGSDRITRPDASNKTPSSLPQHELHVAYFEQIFPLVGESGDPNLPPPRTDLQHKHPLLKNVRLSPEGILFDPRTGLTATLIKNNKDNTLTLAFGGTKSGSDIRLFENRAGNIRKRRFNLIWPQIKADIRNFVGWSAPTIYRQAAELTQLIQQMAEQDKLSLNLTGHSLGGGLAAYSAAKFGLKARTFSPAALGKKTLANLTREQKENANGLIHNYLVTDDPVNNHWVSNPFRMIAAPTIIGTRSVIEEQPATGQANMLGRHIWSHRHYMEVLKKDG